MIPDLIAALRSRFRFSLFGCYGLRQLDFAAQACRKLVARIRERKADSKRVARRIENLVDACNAGAHRTCIG